MILLMLQLSLSGSLVFGESSLWVDALSSDAYQIDINKIFYSYFFLILTKQSISKYIIYSQWRMLLVKNLKNHLVK